MGLVCLHPCIMWKQKVGKKELALSGYREWGCKSGRKKCYLHCVPKMLMIGGTEEEAFPDLESDKQHLFQPCHLTVCASRGEFWSFSLFTYKIGLMIPTLQSM